MTSGGPIESAIFPTGVEISSNSFTGKVWLQRLVTDATFGCTIGNVTFAPGARNSWHKHPAGQVLLITGGTGCYQERGKTVRILHAGDVVEIQPDVEHWHGATPDDWFCHLAISTNITQGEVQWLEPVSGADYGCSES